MTILLRRYGQAFQTPGWRSLVKRLHRNLSASTDTTDCSFWWGERALNGLLGAAASRDSHWSVLEPMSRGLSGSIKRPDMWLGFGGRGDGWFTLEAKLAWTRRANSRLALRKLETARVQLSSLRDEFRTGSPVAVCWVVPRSAREHLSREEGNQLMRQHARALWDHLVQEEMSDQALVVAFAPERTVHHNGRDFYPGVILAAVNHKGLWQGG